MLGVPGEVYPCVQTHTGFGKCSANRVSLSLPVGNGACSVSHLPTIAAERCHSLLLLLRRLSLGPEPSVYCITHMAAMVEKEKEFYTLILGVLALHYLVMDTSRYCITHMAATYGGETKRVLYSLILGVLELSALPYLGPEPSVYCITHQLRMAERKRYSEGT